MKYAFKIKYIDRRTYYNSFINIKKMLVQLLNFNGLQSILSSFEKKMQKVH